MVKIPFRLHISRLSFLKTIFMNMTDVIEKQTKTSRTQYLGRKMRINILVIDTLLHAENP